MNTAMAISSNWVRRHMRKREKSGCDMPRFKSLLCTCGLLCLCSQKQTALSYKGKSSCYLVTGDTQKQNGRILAPGNYTGCFICCMQLRNSGALISPALVGGSTSTSSQRNCNTNGPQKGNASTPKKCMACMFSYGTWSSSQAIT